MEPSREAVIIFDGVCNLCSHSVQFIIRHDHRHVFNFAAAQSNAGRALVMQIGLNPDKLETVVLLKDGQAYIRSDAALEIAKDLDWPWPALRVLRIIPRFFRNQLYELVARNRYRWFGKKTYCMIPTDDLKSRFIE